ncbi:hypothetical protein PDJAM_G00253130 [Pangasius djambal]|uniref:Uncharacterized protein n=1 Tax=Pangasius djambal TaxID=1691987 RepID=A0ACC5YK20_9TELE|nr:hypothetical protein [Pangasius djambal]
MELKWDQAPVTDPGPFSKDVFDKFSLAPTIKELWAMLQSPDEKADVKKDTKVNPAAQASQSIRAKSNKTTPESNIKHGHRTPDCKEALPECKNKAETMEQICFPKPKVPYPCFSSLSRKERVMCICSIKNNKQDKAPQNLIEKVKQEVAEFMKYLQDVSKVCADDYNFMPVGATRYSEEYFKHCLDHMRNYPQVYSIQEIASLTGGKFVPDISLNFEKQLLAMGTIEMVEKQMLPENTQLAVDYESISAVDPPLKKATRFHTPISSDTNAEKLSATYEPHVCLAKEAFLQLLSNSVGFTEAWELPVCVKANPAKGSTQSKTVYIDPPLLKTELTWRERNHLFLEESVKLAYKKTGSNPVFFLTSEDYCNRTDFATEEASSRPVVSFDSTDIDFEADLTDLESFGESCQLKKKVKDNDSKNQAPSKSETLELSKPKVELDKGKTSHTLPEEASPPKDIISALSTPAKEEAARASVEDSSVDESPETTLNSVSEEDPLSSTVEETAECTPTKRKRHSSVNTDSDEERLIIDDPGSPLSSVANKKSQATPAAPENFTDPNTSSVSELNVLSPSNSAKGAKKGAIRPRVSADCDQLGHILRMQNAMLKSKTAKSQEPPKAPAADCRPPEPKPNHHTVSLVKPSVSSYLDLEHREGLQNEPAAPATSQPTAQRKRLLREELLVSAEDEEDYEAPEEGSVLYKLYSLLDVLLMVRSTVSIAHPRHDQETFRAVPVHVLPKLEYQLCYGAECLTHTEACQLWAEQQLHSSTVSFIGRINAHTSKVVQLQELKPDWIQNTSCDFKPARCLNTLHHILKKVMSLQEGRYLLGHKSGEAFLTIFKATDGKKPTRSVCDLQAVHCGPPVIPEAKIPWVPVDPFLLMPFHKKHCRPPCTFPPRPPTQPKAGGCKGARLGNSATTSAQGWQGSAGTPGWSFSCCAIEEEALKGGNNSWQRLWYLTTTPFSLLIAGTLLCIICSLRTSKMALVSEFLGQLTLNFGSSEPSYPTVVAAADFDPDKDAARIETAIKTKGVDEQTIIQILTKRTYGQRREIAFAYERRAKKDMITALKGALSGSLETVILGLMKSTAQYDASEIKASIKGLGTDEESLIEILCSRSNAELVEIKKVYKELFKKDLEKDVAGDTSGDFAKLLLALVAAKRDEPSTVVDYGKIDEDARALYEAGVKRKGTDVKTWISIMSERSVPHLQKVFDRYKSYSPYDMQESIRKEVKGDLEMSFLTLVQCFENKQLYFANRLNDAMKSKGAKEKVVTRIMISRCEVDLKKIRSEFKAQFGKSLHRTISEHTKGDYQQALLSLCGGDD